MVDISYERQITNKLLLDHLDMWDEFLIKSSNDPLTIKNIIIFWKIIFKIKLMLVLDGWNHLKEKNICNSLKQYLYSSQNSWESFNSS